MRLKRTILLLVTLVAINMSSQIPEPANCFGERVIHDFESFYETQQQVCPGCYPETHFWFEDTDTRQMAASFINFHTDSSASDTLFFIRAKSVWSDILECVAGDTVFHLEVCWLKGGYWSFKVDKTPFLNSYSTTYWEKLYTWDTTHLSQPDKYVVSDGSHYYIVRLIYRNRSLLSADFCHHDTKDEYDVNGYDSEKVITLPYPENKQWPKIL